MGDLGKSYLIEKIAFCITLYLAQGFGTNLSIFLYICHLLAVSNKCVQSTLARLITTKQVHERINLGHLKHDKIVISSVANQTVINLIKEKFKMG